VQLTAYRIHRLQAYTCFHVRVRPACLVLLDVPNTSELSVVLPPGDTCRQTSLTARPAGVSRGFYRVRSERRLTGKPRCLYRLRAAFGRGRIVVTVVPPAETACCALSLSLSRRRHRRNGPRLAVTVGHRRAHGGRQAHLITRGGPWEWGGWGLPLRRRIFPAARQVESHLRVAPPRVVETGEWWALFGSDLRRAACLLLPEGDGALTRGDVGGVSGARRRGRCP